MAKDNKGKVVVYSCGGLGANIASILQRDTTKASVGFADMQVCLIDTSRSNLIGSDLPEENIYLVEAKDGSGGVRSTNAQAVLERKLEILQKFKPSDDLNIVVSSGGGGSGSVIAPILVQELLARGLNVIVLLVGSQETVTEANNTLNTLMSYNNVFEVTGCPVVVSYAENDSTWTHKKNDELLTSRITALRVLFSGQNHALDTEDLRGWLHFNKVTSHKKSGIVGLSIAGKESDLKGGSSILSVATLADDAESAALPFMVEYQRKGLMPPAKFDTLPVHYVISDGFLAERVARIEKTLNDFDDATAARVSVNKAPMFTRKGNTGPGGLVL